MAWKTRKQRGSGWLNRFMKKKNTPVTSTTNVTPLLTNNSVSYTRRGSEANFVTMKKRKAFAAKTIRNHVKKLKNLPNNVRAESFKLMNDDVRNKTKTLVNYKNLNSLSNDQVIELYTTGKVRSASV